MPTFLCFSPYHWVLGTPMNEEESNLNVKPILEKYFNLRYLQFGATKEIKGGLFAIQLAREEVLIKKNTCTRCFHTRVNSLFNAKVHWYSKINSLIHAKVNSKGAS